MDTFPQAISAGIVMPFLSILVYSILLYSTLLSYIILYYIIVYCNIIVVYSIVHHIKYYSGREGEGQREHGRRSLWHVSVACLTVWVWFLNVSLSGWSLVVGSLWNVSVCFLWVCVGCLGGCFGCLPDGFAPFYSILFYSTLSYPIPTLLYSILFSYIGVYCDIFIVDCDLYYLR